MKAKIKVGIVQMRFWLKVQFILIKEGVGNKLPQLLEQPTIKANPVQCQTNE
jgi:hypothetical protein